MKRIVLLVGVMVLLLAIPLAVVAQGPGPPEDPGPPENPAFATIDYVDQLIGAVYAYVNQQIEDLLAYVDGQIATVLDHVGQEVARLDARIDGIGGGGEDFDVASADWWTVSYEEDPSDPYPAGLQFYMRGGLARSCRYHDVGISPWVLIRGLIPAETLNGAPAYGAGDCIGVWFWTPVLESQAVFDVDLYYSWMGTTKVQHLQVACGEKTWDGGFASMECSAQER